MIEPQPATEVQPVSEPHSHVVNNGKRDLTLDELATTQPGLDRLMAELGPRMHRLYFAGAAGNWPMASYFYRSVVKQLALCAFSRPKYGDAINTYLAEDCEPVRLAIKDADPARFATTYAAMVARANNYHDDFAKPYLHWVCPTTPPDDLDLKAGMA
jgi:hypothetical protein